MGIRKVVDRPVKVDAIDKGWFKPALYIPPHEIPDKVSHQDLRIIKGQIGMGKKIHRGMLFSLNRNTFIPVQKKC